MSNNQIFFVIAVLLVLAFFGFMTWVMLRGPVERVQADGTPYPKKPHWSEREAFIGPLEPCSLYIYDGPAGCYTIARSNLSQRDIKWFGPDFTKASIKNWLNKFGYYHA